MKKALQVTIVTLGLIAISTFLAPIVYQILPQFKFEKILNRLLMISVVVTCFLFLRFDRKLLEACGLTQRQKMLPHWLIGFFVSFIILIALVVLELGIGAVTLNHDRFPRFNQLFLALLTGMTVGIIEEFFFRGFIFLKLKNKFGCVKALIATNLIYSAAHFIKSGRPLIEGQPTLYDSWRVIGASFHEFLKWSEFWPGFIGLFIFGLVLSYSFKRTGALFVPMGIHAGAVAFLKMTNKLVVPNPDISQIISGGKGFYSGILGWVFIGLIAVFVGQIFRKLLPDNKSQPLN